MAFLKSVGFSGAASNATGNADFQQKLVAFLTGLSSYYTDATTAGGVRLRYIKAKAGAVDETWTITCTNGATGAFSVTGSVSGAQSAATVGAPYSNTYVSFSLLNLNGLAVTGDSFTFAVSPSTLTTAGYAWELYKYDSSTTYAYLRGLGISGNDRIYVAVRNYSNVPSDIYNIAFMGGTGYIESTFYAVTIANASAEYHNSLWSLGIPYVFIANGRRFMFAAKVSTNYESCYCGLFLPTGTPSEYPYPLMIGATSGTASLRYSDATVFHRAFFAPYRSMAVYRKSGDWTSSETFSASDFNNYSDTSFVRVSPFSDFALGKCIDGSYAIYQGYMTAGTPKEILGDIDGLFYIGGLTNASENIAPIGGTDYFVVQNVHRTTIISFAAMRLD